MQKGCTYNRGRKHHLLSNMEIQAIYNCWIEHSLQSTDRQNGKSSCRIPKLQYMQLFKNVDMGADISEVKSKKGKTFLQAEKRISSCTVCKLQEKMKSQGIDVAPSTIQRYKPFFIIPPSDRELQLCMCKLCLNSNFCLTKYLPWQKQTVSILNIFNIRLFDGILQLR